jgi:hypothetical protein
MVRHILFSAHIWRPWLIFFFCLITGGVLMWGALSDERMGLNLLLQLLLGLARAVIIGSKSCSTHVHILLIWDSPNLEVPLEQGGPVIPPDTGFPICHLLGLAGNLPSRSLAMTISLFQHSAVTSQYFYGSHIRIVGVGVLLAADSQSTSSSGYQASLWDSWPAFILLFFFRLTITWFFFLRRPLWWENGSVVYSGITHWFQ